MKIYVFEVEEWERSAFDSLTNAHEINFSKQRLTEYNVDNYIDAEIVVTFIYSDLNADVLPKLKNLQLICTRSTGYDHINVNTCREQGITLATVPNYGKHTVAEHAFALLLTLSRHMEQAMERTRKGNFDLQGLQGFDLKGKTLGIIGTGDIGMSAIKIAKGFTMEVLAYDIKPDEQAAQELGFSYVSLEKLLQSADIISLHVPKNPKTHHMLSQNEFAHMKKGMILINTARGEVVDVKALAQALEQKKVAAAGLDVLSAESIIREESELLRSIYKERKNDIHDVLANEVLLRLPNVIVTPHIAFNTREAVWRLLNTTVENINSFLAGNPQNAVDPSANNLCL